MHTRSSTHIRKIFTGIMMAVILLSLLTAGRSPVAHAQDAGTPQPIERTVSRTLPVQDGKIVEEHSIIGLIEPPPGFEEEREPVVLPKTDDTTIESIGLPGSKWLFGCSAGAAEEIAAGYDQTEPYCISGLDTPADLVSVAGLCCQVGGLINVYDGPTNGGVMPFNNDSWPTWTDGNETYPNNPLIASHQDVDGRETRGTIDDYWVEYNSTAPDPYITGGWPEHEWGDAIGDYMFTSQSKYGNVDGQTKFYIYADSPDPLTSDDAADQQLPDGTLGMRNFYEARGYAVDVAYNQPTNNAIAGGFTFAQYKAEIDAGRPVLIHLENTPQGHTIVGVGYDSATNEVLLHDGWDDLTHKMPWGGSYVGMTMKMISVIHPLPVDISKYTISGYVGAPNVTINYTGGSTTSRANGYYTFAVSPGWSGTVTPSKTGYTFSPASRPYGSVSDFQMKQHFTAAPVALQDPGFELGPSNPYWTGTSTNFETPICTLDGCLEGGQPTWYAAPRTGDAWGWFGGIAADEAATLSQSVTIPNGVSASLKFYFWIGSADPGSDVNDKFTVKVDNTSVFSTDATQIGLYPDYTLVNVDVGAFADGESHTIKFMSNTTGQWVDFNLDDVSLVTTSNSEPPAPFSKLSPPNGAVVPPGTVNLTWEPSEGATSYAYCIDVDETCSEWVFTGTSTSATVTGILPNAAYSWQVSASNANGTTYANAGNRRVFTTTGPTPPGAFNKLSPANGSKVPSSVKLTWQNSANAASYEYCRDMTDDDACDSDAWISTGTVKSVDLSGLEVGKHYWQVRAVNEYGTTYANAGNDWSFEVVAETVYSGTTSRGWPMSFTVSPSGTQWNQVKLKTDYPACSLTMEVTVTGPGAISSGKFSIAGSFAFVAQINASGTASGTYNFKNYFVFGCGNINQSGTWTASKPIPPKVNSVTRVNPSPTRADSVQFKVKFSEPVTGVDVSGPPFDDFALTTGAGLSDVVISSVSGSAAEYIVTVNTGTGNGTIRLNVIDHDSIVDGDGNPLGGTGLGNGNYSAGAIYKVDRGTPSVPVLIAPADNALVTDYTPRLDWSNSTIPVGTTFDHYQLWVATDKAFTNLIVDESISVVTSSEYTFPSDLASNAKFYWKVRASNYKGGTSDWSAYRSFRTAFTPPTLLSPVTPYDALTLRPTFDWGDVVETGVTGYTIQFSTSSTFATITHSSSPVSSAYTPGVDLPRNKLLHWRVRTRGANGPSAWSEVRSFVSANSPTTPVLSLPALNALNTNYTPLFKWSVVTIPAPSVFKHYQLQVDDNADFSSPVLDDISITDRLTVKFQVVTPLAHNARFYWRVRAVNMDDEVGNWSAVRYFRTAIDPPVLLTPTDGATAVSRMPVLTWENVPGNTGYVLQVWKGTTLVKNVTLPPDVSQYPFLTNLLRNTAYSWKVKTKGVNGPSLWSGPFDFTTGP